MSILVINIVKVQIVIAFNFLALFDSFQWVRYNRKAQDSIFSLIINICYQIYTF